MNEHPDLDPLTRADEKALRHAFQHSGAQSERSFVSEAIAAARHPRPKPVLRILLPALAIAATILLLSLLLRPPSTTDGTWNGSTVGHSPAPKHSPSLHAPWPAPASCVEVRRKDLQRRMERQRQRLTKPLIKRTLS